MTLSGEGEGEVVGGHLLSRLSLQQEAQERLRTVNNQRYPLCSLPPSLFLLLPPDTLATAEYLLDNRSWLLPLLDVSRDSVICCAGVQECRSVGVQECRGAGV